MMENIIVIKGKYYSPLCCKMHSKKMRIERIIEGSLLKQKRKYFHVKEDMITLLVTSFLFL